MASRASATLDLPRSLNVESALVWPVERAFGSTPEKEPP
jgi:hypothetical protein